MSKSARALVKYMMHYLRLLCDGDTMGMNKIKNQQTLSWDDDIWSGADTREDGDDLSMEMDVT
jgi:hypothetical protein